MEEEMEGEIETGRGQEAELDLQAMLLRVARLLRGWGQEELAEAGGMDASSVYRYENGKTMPPRARERLLTGAGLPVPFADGCLVPALRSARIAAAPFTNELFADSEAALADLSQALADASRSAVAALLMELDAADEEAREQPGTPS